MIGVIYFIIIILANSVGAVSGMGGGVLIKPIFDLIGAHDVVAISFYSSVAVFVMSLVSTYRQVKGGLEVNWPKMLSLALGSIIGGYLGNYLFELIRIVFQSNAVVQGVQIILTCLTLVFAFVYSRNPFISFRLNSLLAYTFCGLTLGLLASLLGIGGGPINVSLLMLLFSLPIKQATVYSIATIFFSQATKLISIAMTTGFSHYDLTLLYYIVPAAIFGGLIGAQLSRLLNPKKVSLIFQLVIILVLVINIYNGIRLF
ncbi:sulfite exporter TauE/SafE family protein [Streptococcus moroccensis]|uniref:Probable membrane transporter protein n=1 Tax=Streptococcus moroccensis TaxID=1451356 RepID=A0ABT9YRH3_9STRE|nr:sulfite exporter TauE/SafE family protein [Streptococcus moroccensis]MDQ0222595.1 putative membrane protein YfcA [Streptococcus moroccensis]